MNLWWSNKIKHAEAAPEMRDWNSTTSIGPELNAALAAAFELPEKPYSESLIDAMAALEAIFGIKHFSWHVFTGDGTSAEPCIFVDVKSGNSTTIGEGFGDDIPIAICRAMLDAKERNPQHVERAMAWVRKYYPERIKFAGPKAEQ